MSSPSLQKIANEGQIAAAYLQAVMPVSWRFLYCKAVTKIGKGDFAQLDPQLDADGGRAYGIIISASKLNREGNWKDAVWGRVLHEMMHLRLWDLWHALSPDKSTIKPVDDLVEEACESVEIFARFCRASYEKMLATKD